MKDTKRALILTALLASLGVLAYTVRSEGGGFGAVYNSNGEQLLFTSSDAPPLPAPFTPGDCPDCPFILVNNTGTTWTDFHFRIARNNPLLKVHRHHQPKIVALDVEDDPLGGDDAGRWVATFHIGRTGPVRLAHLVEPGMPASGDSGAL